jgi:DNA polymerase/3'-5' exonuclease PolX
MNDTQPGNDEIADVLEQIADLLETQDANPFRVRAYRQGALSVREAERSVAKLVHQGKRQALTRLSGIGEGLASTIEEYVETGRSSQLDRLRGEVSPGDLFKKVPGVGPELAERIFKTLDIHSLEELEQAAHDGRLEEVEGFGTKRIEAVQASLAGMLSQSAQRRSRQRVSGEKEPEKEPDVNILLNVDEEYRRKAKAGELRIMRPGYQSCIPNEVPGTSPLSIQTPPELTNWAKRMIGWSSITTGMERKASTRWSRRLMAASRGREW